MKKLTFLMAMLLTLAVGSSRAQTFKTSEVDKLEKAIADTAVYLIMGSGYDGNSSTEDNAGRFVVYNSSTNANHVIQTETPLAEGNCYRFQIIASGETDKYYIYCVGAGYVTCSSADAGSAKFTISETATEQGLWYILNNIYDGGTDSVSSGKIDIVPCAAATSKSEVAGSTVGWNIYGGNGVQTMGLYACNDRNTAWTLVPYPYLPTGYYAMRNAATDGRPVWAYNDAGYTGNTDNLTLQSSSQITTNNGYWHVTNNGDNAFSIVNGQGTPVRASSSNSYSTVTLGSYSTTNQAYYFLEALNASTDLYINGSGTPCHLTLWSDGGASAADNQWRFVNAVSADNVYTVTITGYTGSDTPYVTYNGSERAYSGGFFVCATAPQAADFTFTEAPTDYRGNLEISGNSILLTYTDGVPVKYTIKDSYTGESWEAGSTTFGKQGNAVPAIDSLLRSYPCFGSTATYSPATIPANQTDTLAVTVTVSSENAPMKFSTSESQTWYTVKLRNNEGNYLVRESDDQINSGGTSNNSTFTKDNVTTYEAFSNGLWAFYLTEGYITLQNKQSMKFVAVDTPNGSKAKLTEAEATNFIMKSNSQAASVSAGFSLQIEGDSTAYLCDNGSQQYLGTWNTPDADVQNTSDALFSFVAVDENETLMDLARTTFPKQFTESNYVGGYLADAQSAATTHASGKTTIAALESFTGYTRRTLDPSKLYRILFKDNGAAMTHAYTADNSTFSAPYGQADGTVTADDPRNVYALEETGLPTLWQFTATGTEKQYTLKNVNSGLTLGQLQSGNTLQLLATATGTEWAGKYTLQQSSTDSTEHIFVMDGLYMTMTDSKTVSASSDSYDVVYIEEVPSVPVTVSAAKYATLTLPFAVTVPEGVTAYYVSGSSELDENSHRVLTMPEITGTIPANTPVILYSDVAQATSYDFAVAAAAAAETESPADNNLFGTTLERHGLTELSYYGLGNKNSTVAFYLVNSTEAPANKAYLRISDLKTADSGTAAVALLFPGGGTATAIGSAAAATAGDTKRHTYYDLNGRIVPYPVRGIYVNGNGEKVFIY